MRSAERRRTLAQSTADREKSRRTLQGTIVAEGRAESRGSTRRETERAIQRDHEEWAAARRRSDQDTWETTPTQGAVYGAWIQGR